MLALLSSRGGAGAGGGSDGGGSGGGGLPVAPCCSQTNEADRWCVLAVVNLCSCTSESCLCQS